MGCGGDLGPFRLGGRWMGKSRNVGIRRRPHVSCSARWQPCEARTLLADWSGSVRHVGLSYTWSAVRLVNLKLGSLRMAVASKCSTAATGHNDAAASPGPRPISIAPMIPSLRNHCRHTRFIAALTESDARESTWLALTRPGLCRLDTQLSSESGCIIMPVN